MKSPEQSSPAPQTPRLAKIRFGELDEANTDLLGIDADRDNERLAGVDLSGRELAGATFSECVFDDVNLDDADLTHSHFNDSRLERVNAPVLRAARSGWRNVEIEHSRIGSGELYDASVNAVRFSNCKIGYLNLRGSTLRDVLFVDCTIDELDLGSVNATRIGFDGTQIRLLDVAGATLRDADLRGAQLRGIRGLDNLRGTTMTEYQLTELSPLFADHLGITIAS